MNNRTGLIRSPFEYSQYYLADIVYSLQNTKRLHVFPDLHWFSHQLPDTAGDGSEQEAATVLVNLAVAGLIMVCLGFTVTLYSWDTLLWDV